jgi:hypothetical protein
MKVLKYVPATVSEISAFIENGNNLWWESIQKGNEKCQSCVQYLTYVQHPAARPRFRGASITADAVDLTRKSRHVAGGLRRSRRRQ